MKIGEFLKKYCSDIMELYEKYKDSDILSKDYDEIIEDEDGYPIKVVWAGSIPIDIEDFFSIDEEEFAERYPGPEALKVREQYLRQFKIVEGFEAFFEELLAIQKEKEKIENDAVMYGEVVSSAAAIPTEEGSDVVGRLYPGGF